VFTPLALDKSSLIRLVANCTYTCIQSTTVQSRDHEQFVNEVLSLYGSLSCKEQMECVTTCTLGMLTFYGSLY